MINHTLTLILDLSVYYESMTLTSEGIVVKVIACTIQIRLLFQGYKTNCGKIRIKFTYCPCVSPFIKITMYGWIMDNYIM